MIRAREHVFKILSVTKNYNDGTVINGKLGGGNTTVSGLVRLNGSTGAGTVTILNAATLRGVGLSLGGNLVVNTGGTFAPGASPGVSTIAGNYVQNGTLAIELAGPGGPGALNGHDQITVGGTVTLGASSVLDLQKFGGFGEATLGQTFNIFDGPDLTGQTFGTVTSAYSTGLVFDLATGNLYGTGLTGLTGVGGSQNVNLAQLAGLSANAQSIIAALQTDAFASDPANGIQFSSNTGAGAFIVSLLTNPNYATTVNAVSAESFAAESTYAIRATRNYAATAQNTAPVVVTENYSLFAAGTSTRATTDSSTDQADYQLESSGGLFGGSMFVNQNLTVGAFIAVDSGDIASTYRRADLSGYAYGVFADYSVNKARTLRLTGELSYGEYTSDSTRTSAVGGPAATASNIESTALGFGLGLSYDVIKTADRGLAPYIGMNVSRGQSEGFTESGPLDALTVRGIDYTSVQGVLGTRGFIRVSEKFSFIAGVELAQEFGDSDTDITSRLASGTTVTRVSSPGFGDTAVSGNVGIRYDVTPRFTLNAGYTATAIADGEKARSYSVGGSVKF